MRVLIPLSLALMGLLPCHAEPEAKPGASLIQKVAVQEGAVVATLAAKLNWVLVVGSEKERLAKPGESISLKPGTTMRFIGRHTSYSMTAQLEPEPGLQVLYRFDGRSVRRGVAEERYFIPAK